MEIEGYGLRMNIPGGWHGSVVRESPDAAVVLQAASTELAPGDLVGTETHRGMRSSDVYIKVIDIGAPPEGLVESDPAWRRDALPIAVDSAELYDTFEGVELPAYGFRSVIVNEHSLMIYVGFGSFPSQADVARANAVLASLRVTSSN
jgi:hypothetical protein